MKRFLSSAEQQQLLKEKTKLGLTINDLMEEVKGDNDSRKRAEEELEKLNSQIAAKEAELENKKPQVFILISISLKNASTFLPIN